MTNMLTFIRDIKKGGDHRHPTRHDRAGYAWIEEHCSNEGYQPFGLGARLAEPRYVAPIIEGAIEDGLAVA